MSEKCAACGNAIFPGQTFYQTNAMGLGTGRESYFHSECGDPFGIKAKAAEIGRLLAALKPFARMADEADNFGGGAPFIDMRISLAELHAAREAFAVEQSKDGKP